MVRTYSILVLCALTFFGVGGAFAQGLPKPFIYEISLKGSHHVSYLFGSFHYGVGVAELPFWVSRLQHNAPVNFFEMDILDDRYEYQAMQDLYLDAQAAETEWGVHNTSVLVDKLVKAGVSRAAAPHFILGHCDMSAYRKIFAYEQVWHGLDEEFFIDAQQSGKDIRYLEDQEVRDQANKKAVQPETPCMTAEMLKDPEKAKEYFDLIEADTKSYLQRYRSGEESQNLPPSDQPDVTYRSGIWVEKLAPQLKQSDSFIVVGIGHLFGDQGLIELLKKRRFSIRRLTRDPMPGSRYKRFSE